MKSSTASNRRTHDVRPSNAERQMLRLKLAYTFGDPTLGTIDYTVSVRKTTVVGKGEDGKPIRVRTYADKTFYSVPRFTSCHLCNAPLQIERADSKFDYMEEDRIDPNGHYVMPNLLPCCRSCNGARGNAELPEAHVVKYRARFNRGESYYDLRKV